MASHEIPIPLEAGNFPDILAVAADPAGSTILALLAERSYDVVLPGKLHHIDPVFSTAVLLAMNSAFAGAEVIDECLRNSAMASRALKKFDQPFRHGLKIFS